MTQRLSGSPCDCGLRWPGGRWQGSDEVGAAGEGTYVQAMAGETRGGDYDRMAEFASHPTDTDATVAGLASLAGDGGRVLELGVGTGRLAIPLSQMVREVHGVELEPEMADALRAKPGGERVHVHLADMSRPVDAGPFDLVFVAFGTLFALPTQDDQVRCFQSAAEQLNERGKFVVEALVPQPASYTDGRKVVVAGVDDRHVVLNVGVLDSATQTVATQQVALSENSIELFPNTIRYAWPAELDLMARLAGLRLTARWSDWARAPFDQRSPRHISVYGRA
jgi:SAM-dependent methyltransferase